MVDTNGEQPVSNMISSVSKVCMVLYTDDSILVLDFYRVCRESGILEKSLEICKPGREMSKKQQSSLGNIVQSLEF